MKRIFIRMKRIIPPLLMLAPSVVGVMILYIIPLINNFSECFTEGVNEKVYVGFKNFTDLFSNKAFALAVENTLRFYAIAIPALLIIPLLLALAAVRNKKISSICTGAMTMPIVMPLVSVMLVLDSFFVSNGFLNSALEWLGMAPINTHSDGFSFVYLVIVFVFRYSGYNFLLYLAGRVRIKKEYYEVAALDGAGSVRSFFKITLPLMMPTFFLTFIVTIINSYKLYREAYWIGGDYPNETIYMIQHFINNNLHSLNYHRLAAASVLILIVTLVIVGILFFIQSRVEVES
ncbi:MAG: sugar ABC transporter permease [Clostridia bacterium]|nr:sugar ABC transporter permease [Clostridia bacterium]